VGGLYPQHRVWPEIASLPLRIERGIVVQKEPAALCSKLWPHPGNALQQSPDNFNVESIIVCPPFRNRLFMSHTLLVNKSDQHGFEPALSQTKLFGPWWWLWAAFHVLKFRLWFTLIYPQLVPSYNAVKKTRIVLTSLDEASLRCFCASVSVSLCGTNLAHIFLFRKSSWRIRRIDVWFIRHRSETRTFAIVSTFREIKRRSLFGSSWRSSRHCYDLWLQQHREMQHVISFCWCFTRFNTQFDIHSLLHDNN
jgi:hypothetical protein